MAITSTGFRAQLRADQIAAQAAYRTAQGPVGSEPRTPSTDVMLALARAEARLEAHQHRLAIAFGLQLNDVTGEQEPGWCPASHAYRPGVLVLVHGIAQPDGAVDAIDIGARVPAWASSLRVAS